MTRAMRRVAVIGLGRMGLPIARHLVRAGFLVAGFDLDPARTAALTEAGGEASLSVLAAAAGSDAVLVMVADDAQVTSVTLGPEGAIAGLQQGGAVIISSTIKPSTVQAVSEAAAERGVGVLDAPVARGQRAAEEGTLTAFVGGAGALFKRCLPIFRAFCREVVHIDDRVGAGQVAKLANNLILWAGVVAVHESLALAERLGVSPGRLRNALTHGSADGYALRELHLINLTWPHKDLEQAMEVAADIAHPLPLAGTVGKLIRTLTKEELRRLCRDDTEPESSRDPRRRPQ